MTETKVIDETKSMLIQPAAHDKYRQAFLLTLVALIAVVAVAGWLWWRSPGNPIMRRVQPAATANAASGSSQTAAPATAPSDDSAAPPSETPVAPIQLSPQRMQSIGVKIGTVESKTIS